MESTSQADSQAWSLWARLARPALLWYPVLGISAVLVVSTPYTASARALPRSQKFTSSEPTQRQLRTLRSYERYLARVRVQTVRARRAVKFAYRQVGKPYQWGGAGPRTYDCSGLAMAAWRKGGLSLPHRADLQHRIIRRKVGLKHLQPGDLVFFSGDHHVGIYVGRGHFLHAPHTGTRVQRGSLTGWRIRAFAGAARPGAPAYHPWPHWVRALAGKVNEHTTRPAPRPGANDHAATRPGSDAGPRPAVTLIGPPYPSHGKGRDDAGSTTGPEAVQPPAGASAGGHR
jgi:cell wall-associated NlpC family hydrolase